MPEYKEIEDAIRESVSVTVHHMLSTFPDLQKEVSRYKTAYLVINSSFLHRGPVKTLQSPKRLAIRVHITDGPPEIETIVIASGLTQKSHYKFFPEADIQELCPLEHAVADGVTSLGDLIFVLIGTVKGLRPVIEQVEGQEVMELRLDPAQSDRVSKVDAGIYAVKEFVAIEDVFDYISRSLQSQDGLSEKDRQAIARAYDALLDNATTEVVIPREQADSNSEATTLGQIVRSLNHHANEYREALTELQTASDDSKNALNNVLRIAYNFSSDVLPLISLFMSICDLKPIVFWCTVEKQWALYQAFAALPWSALGRKEKLDEYQRIISEARNQAFHHVLPFDSTVEIDVSGLDVRAETVRLFAPFGSKRDRGVRLRDQDLADVLAEFSRAKQRPVSKVFWQSNQKVLEAAADLAQDILDALLMIHRAKMSSR